MLSLRGRQKMLRTMQKTAVKTKRFTLFCLGINLHSEYSTTTLKNRVEVRKSS